MVPVIWRYDEGQVGICVINCCDTWKSQAAKMVKINTHEFDASPVLWACSMVVGDWYLSCNLLWYDTIQYDSVYLTCSKKLTGSQLSSPHRTNQKLKSETKNKMMSVIGPVQSHYHEGSPVGKRSLRWEGFVEKVGFEPGVKEWRSDGWWEWWW